jgi:hypothetical protein
MEQLLVSMEEVYGFVADRRKVRSLARRLGFPKQIGMGHADLMGPRLSPEQVAALNNKIWGYRHRN